MRTASAKTTSRNNIVVTFFCKELRIIEFCIVSCSFQTSPTHLSPVAAGLDEDSKVADLVWNLVQQNGDCGDESNVLACQVRCTNSKSICKVVGEVCCKIQVP